MDCLLVLIAATLFVLVGAYALGYSVMGWLLKPLEKAAENENEKEIVIEVRVEEGDDGEEGDEPAATSASQPEPSWR
jgi:hypothetical protein